jgi:hypothetical protein
MVDDEDRDEGAHVAYDRRFLFIAIGTSDFLFCRVGFHFLYKRRHDWHAHGWRQGGSLAVAHVYSLLAKDNIFICIMHVCQ